jgi:hypothetical protein
MSLKMDTLEFVRFRLVEELTNLKVASLHKI